MGEMAPRRQMGTDFPSDQSLSSVELGVKLSACLGRSACRVAGFPARASTGNVVLFPEQCFSSPGVRRAGLSRLGLFVEPQAGASTDGGLSLQGCSVPAARVLSP